MALNESKRRDFVSQLIILIESKSQEFTDAGYDPANKLSELKYQSQAAEVLEVKQQEAKASAKDITAAAQESLDTAYRNASDTVELITGLLGKKHNLVKEIKKMRK